MFEMGVICNTTSLLTLAGRIINQPVSFVVFSFLDLVDFLLCFLFKVADFFFESERKACYCASSKEVITNSGKILVSEQGESAKIVSLTSSKLQLEEISDTLYSRPSLLSELSTLTINELKKLSVDASFCEKTKKKITGARSTFAVNSTVIEMLQCKIGDQQLHHVPRWSDCDCGLCTSWASSCKDTLFVRTQDPKDNKPHEDVLFIHGFISSSAFWTETLFPNFSNETKSSYRLHAVDLLGFGRSPKPNDSFYTLREHLDMIDKSVLEAYNVKSFHIVAHSLGCILALALAVKHPGSIKSLTLLAPPCYEVPRDEEATQYVMRKVAPRRVWPPMAFGASLACWYEHISRTICLLVCKNHRFLEFLTKLITRNRIRTFLFEGFFCHTHNAAWHTLHNIICGTAGKLDTYMNVISDNLGCKVTIFHGKDDQVIPLECTYNVKKCIPRARVEVVEDKDHITIVVGRQKAFAGELEEIWRNSTST